MSFMGFLLWGHGIVSGIALRAAAAAMDSSAGARRIFAELAFLRPRPRARLRIKSGEAVYMKN
jgi:hypothetical protein